MAVDPQLRRPPAPFPATSTTLNGLGAEPVVPGDGLYRGYGLTLRSEIPLPEMSIVSVGSGTADVDIVLGPVSEDAGWRQVGPRVFGTSGILRFGPRARATILASHGRRIVVQLGEDVPPAIVRPYLLSSGMGAVLHQRSFLPLHASVVETADGCVALMGHRGAGKSTLAAFIASTGGAAVSDDICAVTVTDDRPVAWPNRQRFKLAADAAAYLHLECADAERLPGGKLSIAVRATGDDEPRPLRALCVLTTATTCALRRLERAEALAALVTHTFRPRYVIGLGIEREHLQRCATVAATTPVFSLSTIRDLSRLDDVARLVALSPRRAGAPS